MDKAKEAGRVALEVAEALVKAEEENFSDNLKVRNLLEEQKKYRVKK